MSDSQPLIVTVVRSADALDEHVEAWEKLVAAAAEPNPFLEPHALLPAWRELGEPTLEVVLVWSPNPLPGQPPHLVGLFPILRQDRFKGLPLAIAETWKHLYMYSATPLVHSEIAVATLTAFVRFLHTEGVKLFTWRGITTNGAFGHALLDTLDEHGLASFVDNAHTRAMFRPSTSSEQFLERAIRGKKRKELRRQERRLAELGTLTFNAEPPTNLDAWLDEFLDLEERGWKGREGTAMRRDPRATAAFRALARGAFTRGRWMSLSMRLDGKPLAMKCNLRAGDGAVAFKIAYDEEYAKFSPGVLLEIEQIRLLHEPNAPAWMDSGASAAHPMINHLWRDRTAIETLVVPTGHALGSLAVAALPLLRWGKHAVRGTVRRLKSR